MVAITSKLDYSSIIIVTNRFVVVTTINNTNLVRTFVTHLRLGGLLTKSDHETLYKVIFARRAPNEYPSLQSCLYKIAIGTRVKMTSKDNEDEDEILIYYRYNSSLTSIPRFESELLSCYDEKEDREFKLLSKNKNFCLISTAHIRLLSPPELMCLRKQFLDFIERKQPLGFVKIWK